MSIGVRGKDVWVSGAGVSAGAVLYGYAVAVRPAGKSELTGESELMANDECQCAACLAAEVILRGVR